MNIGLISRTYCIYVSTYWFANWYNSTLCLVGKLKIIFTCTLYQCDTCTYKYLLCYPYMCPWIIFDSMLYLWCDELDCPQCSRGSEPADISSLPPRRTLRYGKPNIMDASPQDGELILVMDRPLIKMVLVSIFSKWPCEYPSNFVLLFGIIFIFVLVSMSTRSPLLYLKDMVDVSSKLDPGLYLLEIHVSEGYLPLMCRLYMSGMCSISTAIPTETVYMFKFITIHCDLARLMHKPMSKLCLYLALVIANALYLHVLTVTWDSGKCSFSTAIPLYVPKLHLYICCYLKNNSPMERLPAELGRSDLGSLLYLIMNTIEVSPYKPSLKPPLSLTCNYNTDGVNLQLDVININCGSVYKR